MKASITVLIEYHSLDWELVGPAVLLWLHISLTFSSQSTNMGISSHYFQPNMSFVHQILTSCKRNLVKQAWILHSKRFYIVLHETSGVTTCCNKYWTKEYILECLPDWPEWYHTSKQDHREEFDYIKKTVKAWEWKMKCLLPGLQQLLKPNTHGLSTYTDTFGTIKEVNDFCKACKNGFRQYTGSMEQARRTIEDVQPTPKPPPVTVMSCPCKSR